MKRRMLSWLLVLSLLLVSLLPVNVLATDVATEGDLPGVDPFEEELDLTTEEAQEAEQSEGAPAEESAEELTWEEKAEAVKLTGRWREDLVNIAQSQVGYAENEDGTSIYGIWADRPDADWTAHFINWVAVKAGLSEKDFPHGNTYKYVRIEMNDRGALKRASRYNFPNAGDLALIEVDGKKMVGIVVFTSMDKASVIHGDDNGQVTQNTYKVGTAEFDYYADLNVLMKAAGIETGQGSGSAPAIPAEGVTAWTSATAVYMRAEPTVNSKRVTTVKKSGTPLTVTSAEKQQDGYIWYGVEYEGKVGYIRGDLITLDMQNVATATPKPTPKPTAKPTAEPTAKPDVTDNAEADVISEGALLDKTVACDVCMNALAAAGLENEEPTGNCFYADLVEWGIEASYSYLYMIHDVFPMLDTYNAYIACHDAHVANGDKALICNCGKFDAHNPNFEIMPDATHALDCPWYMVINTESYTFEDSDAVNANVNIQVEAATFEETYILKVAYPEFNTAYAQAVNQAAAQANLLGENESNAALKLFSIGFESFVYRDSLKPNQDVTLTFIVKDDVYAAAKGKLHLYYIYTDETGAVQATHIGAFEDASLTLATRDMGVYAVCEIANASCTVCGTLPMDACGFLIDCAYAHMQRQGSPAARYAFLTWLKGTSDAAYNTYITAYEAHITADTQALICTCTDSAAMTAPGSAHKGTCPWHMADADYHPVVMPQKLEDGSYQLYMNNALLATTVKLGVTDENPDGDGYNYIKDEKTGLIVAYLWFDSANQPWIIPLKSSKAN